MTWGQQRRQRMQRNRNTRPFAPLNVPGLVAWWSGNDATVSSARNRLGAVVGAMAQSTPADQPSIIFTNGVSGTRALRFDGTSDDMSTPDVAALRSSPQLYIAMHCRRPSSGNSGAILAQWGAAERVRINFISNTRFETRVAIDATTTTQRNYNFTNAAFEAGIWLEFLYDGSQATPADREVFAVDGTPLAVAGLAGTLPTTLQAGDATDVWIASENGVSNCQIDIAHLYVANAVPSAGIRTALRAIEVPQWA